MNQREKADRLRTLHQGPDILLLPNAWDAASARIFAAEGFPAIATTSAGIANALGWQDGEHIPRDEMLWMIKKIVKAVDLPVTADVEAGYGDAADTALQLMEAGVVGMNLEDAEPSGVNLLTPIAEQQAKIQAIRRIAGASMVVNARTDIFLAGIGPAETRLERTVERLNAYHDAGADCLFAPGVTDAATIRELVKSLHGPLNILAMAGTPEVRELSAMGVARVSVGSGIMRASLELARTAAREMRSAGTFSAFTDRKISFAGLNKLMA
jgi:2-methylisocitrate lyase-like PEP mutase family enzyme